MKRTLTMLIAASCTGVSLFPVGGSGVRAQAAGPVPAAPPTIPAFILDGAVPLADAPGTGDVLMDFRRVPAPPPADTLEFTVLGEGSTWLGVHIVQVPKALASHLRLDGPALMIQNVAKESPADEAGLAQFDVIVECDGTPVPKDVAAFTEHVRKMAPGTTIRLVVLRRGERRVVSVTLGEMPRSGRIEYKYEPDPDAILRDIYGIRGKILRPLPGGGYRLDDLGELPDLPGLAPFYAPPQRPGEPPKPFTTPLPAPGADRQREWSGRWTRPDGAIHVHVDADGRITVKRSRGPGTKAQEDVRVYDNADDLKKDDPDAYELYRKLDAGRRPGGVIEYRAPEREELRRRMEEWQKAFRDRMEDLERHRNEAKREIEKRMEELERWLADRKRQEATARAPGAHPAVSFSVDPSGRISVTVREGDSEITKQFENEEQFKTRAPELYNRFEQMNERVR